MPDNPGVDPEIPTEPTYPDGAAGLLMKQRDDLQRTIDSDKSMAQMYADRAAASAVTLRQLDDAIQAVS